MGRQLKYKRTGSPNLEDMDPKPQMNAGSSLLQDADRTGGEWDHSQSEVQAAGSAGPALIEVRAAGSAGTAHMPRNLGE